MSATIDATSEVLWRDVVGQDRAVRRLQQASAAPVHAYLFVGPSGATKKEAARAFAALVLGGAEGPSDRDVELVLRGEHPDVAEVERNGPAISAEQAREIVRTSSLAPTEGARKVMILNEFHLLRPEGAALLLKTIEEPPDSTTFIVLADFIPNDLITISSRCVRVDFQRISDETIVERLVAEGSSNEAAVDAAAAAGGDLDRARLLASDPDLVARRQAFAEVPRRLDGTGATVMKTVDELMGLIEQAAAPLSARHETEVADMQARIERYGERGSGKKALEDRHKRELRRHRTDELRAGLSQIAQTYRDELVGGSAVRPNDVAAAVTRLHEAIEALERNPNETLLMQALLWDLPVLTSR